MFLISKIHNEWIQMMIATFFIHPLYDSYICHTDFHLRFSLSLEFLDTAGRIYGLVLLV